MRISSLLCLCVIAITGCDNQPVKTDSMLHLEKVQQQVQLLIDKLDAQMTPEVLAVPQQNVSTILYAYELLAQIDEVYRQGQVKDLRPASLRAIENDLRSLNTALATYSIELMDQLVEKTLSLRQKISAIKMAEVGAAKASSETSIAIFAKHYNEDIEACCLRDIYKVRQILATYERKQFEALIAFSGNVTSELVSILQDPDAAHAYKQKLTQLHPSQL
ncbi:hypothetical protein P2G88_08795 [Aliiglaciecola sp. CAU 1673]|uniref:hypothetical protein n=1 Tax=Aliiglaciecola sp. CAU 1673 TaxID=3032595 RepID=UPI0023DA4675|nr:hypothetical protein [Aliiglaciecola sp. CAU 1673]MDF2178347.1 hypothetical protein [Aliiglaciecola sp. CAU 1673]